MCLCLVYQWMNSLVEGGADLEGCLLLLILSGLLARHGRHEITLTHEARLHKNAGRAPKRPSDTPHLPWKRRKSASNKLAPHSFVSSSFVVGFPKVRLSRRYWNRPRTRSPLSLRTGVIVVLRYEWFMVAYSQMMCWKILSMRWWMIIFQSCIIWQISIREIKAFQALILDLSGNSKQHEMLKVLFCSSLLSVSHQAMIQK